MARILVINDDPRATAIREALAASGYEIHTAATPDDTHIHAHDPALVILTVLVPGRDSLHALQDLRCRFLNVPIITVTGRPASPQDAHLLEQLGATRVIEHPFHPAKLLALVASTLRMESSKSTPHHAHFRSKET